MSRWPEITVGSVAEVKSGFAFKSRDWRASGVPVVRIADVHDGAVDLSAPVCVENDVAERASAFRISTGDVLITMSGRIGDVGLMRAADTALLNQRVGRFRIIAPGKIDRQFLFYALRDPARRMIMEAHAYGVAQPNISPELIHDVPIPCPPVVVQRKIAAVLAAYDELIENNLRRIEILEEMAQAVYREWFVNFRFPGHEDVAMVDSPLGPIPEGWEVHPLESALVFRSGKTISKEARSVGSVPVYGANGVIGHTNQKPLTSLFSIALGKIGSCGALHRIETPAWVTNNAFWVEPGAIHSLELGWFVLKSIDFQRFIGGAANPYMPLSNFGHVEVLVPDGVVQHLLHEATTPMSTFRKNLELQNANLRATRDLLLPRLVSGQIDVSDLDIDTGWLAL